MVALHGFTQTRRSWLPVVHRLEALHRFTLVDAPGHGASGTIRAGLWDGAELLGQGGGTGVYLGYSMGARFCLHLALARPEMVTGLVLLGVHPGITDVDERRRRRHQDELLAERLEQIGVAAFVDGWLRQPMFATLDPASAGREERLTNTVEGLASSLRLAGTGSQDPLWHRLPELKMPVLLVVGAADAKFSDLGRQAADAIGPNASLVVIPDAGHACHLEQPDAFCSVLGEFLADP